MLAIAAVCASGPMAGAASPGEGEFTVRPGHTDPNDPITQAYFKRTVAAGGTFSDSIIIGNTSDAPINLVLSPVDGLTAQTSGAVYANRQDPARKAGTWATLAASTTTVDPHTERSIDFTGQVPSDADPGDHLLGLAVESADSQTSGGSFQVKKVMRVVVGVLIRVQGPAGPHLKAESVKLEKLPGVGTASVLLRFGNDGRTLLKSTVEVTLQRARAGSTPAYRKEVSRRTDTLLPGDMIDFPFPWPDDLAPGRYDIHAVVTTDGASAEVNGQADLRSALRGTSSKVTPGAAGGSSMPWWLIPGIVAVSVLATLGGAFAVRQLRGANARRKRRRDDPDVDPDGVVVNVGRDTTR